MLLPAECLEAAPPLPWSPASRQPFPACPVLPVALRGHPFLQEASRHYPHPQAGRGPRSAPREPPLGGSFWAGVVCPHTGLGAGGGSAVLVSSGAQGAHMGPLETCAAWKESLCSPESWSCQDFPGLPGPWVPLLLLLTRRLGWAPGLWAEVSYIRLGPGRRDAREARGPLGVTEEGWSWERPGRGRGWLPWGQ